MHTNCIYRTMLVMRMRFVGVNEKDIDK